MDRRYDAVIIGSGFGGGIAACRLAAAGWKVCVLERGRRFDRGDFPQEPEQAPLALWHPTANPGGLFDIRLMRDVAVLTSAGVGGGSLIYANVQLRAPADVFAGGWPAAIDRAELDPYYDLTEEALQPRPTPLDPPLAKVAAFATMAQRAGREAERLPIAVHFGEARRHPFSGVHQSGCENLGRCVLGCPVRAKNSIDLTYLARAESDGAEVYPSHEADRLDPPPQRGGDWTIGYADRGYRTRGIVRGGTVILAAGALGSTRLLLRNRRRLRGLSAALGTKFSGNGDALGMAFGPRAPGVAAAREDIGPTMTSYVDYTAERQLIVADGGLPATWSPVFDVLRGVNAIVGWRRPLLRVSHSSRLGLSDRPLHPRTIRLRRRQPITDSIVFMIFGRDAANGRIRLTRFLRRLEIDWDRAASEELFKREQDSVNELSAAAEATPFYSLAIGPLAKFATVHPLGGCPMSDDPATGVVDDVGRVYGHDGLLVLDGSIVPSAIGVNPSKTIAALAERGAARLVREQA